jgi:hypothetical protein
LLTILSLQTHWNGNYYGAIALFFFFRFLLTLPTLILVPGLLRRGQLYFPVTQASIVYGNKEQNARQRPPAFNYLLIFNWLNIGRREEKFHSVSDLRSKQAHAHRKSATSTAQWPRFIWAQGRGDSRARCVPPDN